MRSYDDHQIEAVLVTCLACRKAYYMTTVVLPCATCRSKGAK
jgi:hypothetical protein